MPSFKPFTTGEQESQFRQWWSHLFSQVSIGKAKTGVLSGLAVTATTPGASGSVVVGAGAGQCQPTTAGGAIPLVEPADEPVDVFTANPMQFVANPRNDIIGIDSATGLVTKLIGVPNATPSLGEQPVPTTMLPLARLRHLAGATTIPASAIDDLRPSLTLLGALTDKFFAWGRGIAATSDARAGKKLHWDTFTSMDVNRSNATGIHDLIPHGCGFTPSTVLITPSNIALQCRAFNLTATTFDIQVINSDGSANGTSTFVYSALFGE